MDRSTAVAAARDIHTWKGLSQRSAEDATHLLAPGIRGCDYVSCQQYSLGFSIATFRHQSSELEFQLIPGGTGAYGLSDDEYRAASALPEADLDVLDSLRPQVSISVPPFLFSRLPLTQEFVKRHTVLQRGLYRPDFRPSKDVPGLILPIYLTLAELEPLCSKFGFSLPTEHQWEYVARATTTSLFYFGDELPDERDLADHILLNYFTPERLKQTANANPFGVHGLMLGSWCSAGSGGANTCVVRGGAAIYWPWQNVAEWMLCMSAMRRSADEMEDGTCSAHVVLPVTL